MHQTDTINREVAAWGTHRRMAARVDALLNRELARRTGLSEADFVILCALADMAGAPMRALALRYALEWEKSRLSHQLRRMEQRGLVVRDECGEDSRGTVVRLTDKGRGLVTEARRCYQEALHRHVFDALTPEQVDDLCAIAATVLRHLDAY